MQIAARTAAWAKSGYTAKDYSQTGLLFNFDGIENSGYEDHRTGTRWLDLISGNVFNVSSLESDYASVLETQSCLLNRRPRSVEIVCMAGLDATPAQTDNAIFSTQGYGPNISGLSDYVGARFGDTSKHDKVTIGTTSAYYILGDAFSPADYGVPFYFAIASGSSSSVIYINGIKARDAAGYFAPNPSFAIVNGLSGVYVRGIRCRYYAIRGYDRMIDRETVAANYAIDKARFNLT